jgi:hypothetical protein
MVCLCGVNNKMMIIRDETQNIASLQGIGGKITPSAYTAFVGTEKIQKRLKSKQRQQERKALWLRAYLSFVGSFFFYAWYFLYACKRPHLF